MALSLLVLGSGSALPTVNANQTSLLLKCNNQSYLVDCGEGTQVQLRKNKVKMQAINHIFISHLHGDHYYGLVGLLSTMHLLGRTKPIFIHGPNGLEEIVRLQFRTAGSHLCYTMNFTIVESAGQQIVDDHLLEVYAIPLKHRIPCFGFFFKEKKGLQKLKVSALAKYKIPVYARRGITEGQDFQTENGEIIPNQLLTDDPPNPNSFAYCSDTAYYEPLQEYIHNVDLIYHEATFLEQDIDRARKTYHSTAKQAALVAKNVAAKKLLLGHFSNRYADKNEFIVEAQSVFSSTFIAEEGVEFTC